MLSYVEGMRLTRKGDLVAFAAKRPGALSGWFLAGVYARLCKGSVRRSRHLREANVGAWVSQCGLTDIRDLREVMTLAAVIGAINRREVSRAMDVLSQRILAVQAAKGKKGGAWEKAEALELIPGSGHSMLAGGMAALTG